MSEEEKRLELMLGKLLVKSDNPQSPHLTFILFIYLHKYYLIPG